MFSWNSYQGLTAIKTVNVGIEKSYAFQVAAFARFL